MDYFALAKRLVRMNEEWRQHGHLSTGEEPRLPEADLPVLLRSVRPQEQGISGDAGVSLLLRRL